MNVIWEKTDTIIVAVSGGIDSVVLLHAIAQNVNKENVVVVHVNHGMRETATRDCLFVKRLAKKYGVTFETNVSIPQLVTENDARVFRYEILQQVVKKYNAKYVLTAHHQDDQVETFLWRLMRGDGVNSLLGIPQLRELGDGVVLYRPLLGWSKSKILQYAEQYELQHVEDETNAQLIYTRNRLRQTILPVLRQEQEHFDTHVVQLQDELIDMLMHLDETLLQSPYIIDDKLQLLEFRKLPKHSQRVLLSRWLIQNGQPTRFVDAIMSIAQQSGGQKQLSLNSGFLYVQSYNVAQIMLPKEQITPPQEIIRNFPYTINDYEITLGTGGIVILPSDLPLCVRGVEQGDKIRLSVGQKKVSRVLIDAKVPRDERSGIMLLVTANNRVLSILDKRCENLSKTQETGKIKKCNQIIITIGEAIEK